MNNSGCRICCLDGKATKGNFIVNDSKFNKKIRGIVNEGDLVIKTGVNKVSIQENNGHYFIVRDMGNGKVVKKPVSDEKAKRLLKALKNLKNKAKEEKE